MGRATQQVPDDLVELAPSGRRPGSVRRLGRALSFRNFSALYVFAVIFVVFSVWEPSKFLTLNVWKTILENQAITALAAVGLVVPLGAGMFDLAVGTEVGLGVILISWLLAHAGIPAAPAVLMTLLAGGAVGLTSGLLVTRVKIDSFIATLGISSILTAAVSWISGDEQIIGLSSGFQSIAQKTLLGITLPVYVMLAGALVVWYMLEVTPAGRRIYATGGNREAARLAGVPTSLVIVMSFMVCGVAAALAGVLESATLGGGDPTIGPSYLLPAFTAAFLGSTQFRSGRFNVWGTVVAVYVLQTGVQGFELAGAPVWIPDLFNGVALLASVGLARYERRAYTLSAIRRLLRFQDADSGTTPSAPADFTVREEERQ